MERNRGKRRLAGEETVAVSMALVAVAREGTFGKEARRHRGLRTREIRSCRTRTSRHWILVSPTT